MPQRVRTRWSPDCGPPPFGFPRVDSIVPDVSTRRCMRRLSAGIPQTIGRAYAPMAFITTGVLEVERREVQLVCALGRCERDGEVLDREAGRVEDRDLAPRLPAGRLSHENCA